MKRYGIIIAAVFFATIVVTSTAAFAADSHLGNTRPKNMQNGGFQGHVKSGGKGISGATVTAQQIVPATGFTVSATTDSKGYYVIDIPTGREGTYRLSAKADGYISQTKNAVTMPPLYVTVDFSLTKNYHSEKSKNIHNIYQHHMKNINPVGKPKPKQELFFGIHGYVLDSKTGKGVANAELTAHLPGSMNSYSTKTDSKGYYVLDVSLPGIYKVKVTAEGYLTKRLTIPITGPLYLEVNISLTKTKSSQQKNVNQEMKRVGPINPLIRKTVYSKNTVPVFNPAFWKTKIVESDKYGNSAILRRYISSLYHIS